MIFCADDYGLAPGVNAAILDLVEKRRLSAVSCMMTEPDIAVAMKNLMSVTNKIDVGLHLVLTDVKPLSTPSVSSGLMNADGQMPSFKDVAGRCFFRRVDSAAIHKEIKAQLELFFQLTGRWPDFIDGHQHVQQLPTVRTALLGTVLKDARLSHLYIRVAGFPSFAALRAMNEMSPAFYFDNVGIAFPGFVFRRRLKQSGLRHNRFLLGYLNPRTHSFTQAFHFYSSLAPTANDIFFLHPGRVDRILELRDGLTAAREEVYQFLLSDDFVTSLEKKNITINRFESSDQPSK